MNILYLVGEERVLYFSTPRDFNMDTIWQTEELFLHFLDLRSYR